MGKSLKPEILSPAGDFASFRAALAHGADAVYLAGELFGARAYAPNFTEDEIREALRLAHLYGKKLYVTVNTVVKEKEFPRLIAYLDALASIGVDAVIVQDLGVLALAADYPNMAFHASTQMNIMTTSAALSVKALGAQRVILAREASLLEAEKIQREAKIPVEVFCYGALCLAYSGNCYLSSLQGERSGNRGRCAQCCRQVYRFQTEGVDRKGYLLSMKDLSTLDRVPELVASGIESLKIEGRMKKPAYVAAVTSAFRARVDGTRSEKEDWLPEIFSRGLTKGYLFSAERATVVNPDTPNHQGIKVGVVMKPDRENVQIKLSHELSYGDGLRITSREGEDALVVNDMYRVLPHERRLVKKAFPGEIISLKAHKYLDSGEVYRTSSAEIEEHLARETASGPSAIEIEGVLKEEAKKLILIVSDGVHCVRAESTEPYVLARSDQSARIRSALLKTGATPYVFKSLHLELPEAPFLSLSLINALRREALKQLTNKRLARDTRIMPHKTIVPDREQPLTTQLIVRVRTEEQYQESLRFPGIARETENIAVFRTHYADEMLSLVLPRITQSAFPVPNKERTITHNLDHEGAESGEYMNVTNARAVLALEGKGFNRVALSPELSLDEIKELVQSYQDLAQRKPCLSLLAYGYPDAMITRFCPMRAYASCAKCQSASSLIDHAGHVFPLIRVSDPKKEECFTRILFHEPVSHFAHLQDLKSLGISPILSFTIEDASETRATLEAFVKRWTTGEGTLSLPKATAFHFEEGMA